VSGPGLLAPPVARGTLSEIEYDLVMELESPEPKGPLERTRIGVVR
jgi:hypothetical protein